MQYYLDKRDNSIVDINEFNRQCDNCNSDREESNVPCPCHGFGEDRCPYFVEVDTRDHDMDIRKNFGKWLDSLPFWWHRDDVMAFVTKFEREVVRKE